MTFFSVDLEDATDFFQTLFTAAPKVRILSVVTVGLAGGGSTMGGRSGPEADGGRSDGALNNTADEPSDGHVPVTGGQGDEEHGDEAGQHRFDDVALSSSESAVNAGGDCLIASHRRVQSAGGICRKGVVHCVGVDGLIMQGVIE